MAITASLLKKEVNQEESKGKKWEDRGRILLKCSKPLDLEVPVAQKREKGWKGM